MKRQKDLSKKDALKLISKSSIYGNLGLFIGAGLSMGVLNNSMEKVALSWKELILECSKELGIKLTNISTEGLSYPEIATNIVKTIAKDKNIEYANALTKFKEKISALTSWYPETQQRIEYGKLLETISPSWIITTNYDLNIECLLTGKSLSLGPNDQLISPKNLIPIYHLHGIRTNPNSIIITQEDYISLFRPNQYRQQKLSLSIKESTTLIIGYGLGDVNVLTSVDWSKNVYSNQQINYPHDIIQLLYTDFPREYAYRDMNEILIIEFDNLKTILTEISDIIVEESKIVKTKNKELKSLNDIFKNPTNDIVLSFIEDSKFRKTIIEKIAKNDEKLISGFLELFSKSIDETWKRSEPNGAFYAYDENLKILLDIIENISLEKIPPVLLESVAYNLSNIGYYVGLESGKSREAYYTWNNRKTNIPDDTVKELKNISIIKNYFYLKKLLSDM